jgi:hypothetical protein
VWAVRPETERHARQGLTVSLALYGTFLAVTPDHYGLMDSVDLAIHEAGHPLFAIFGEFIGYAGGTLMQLLVPAVFLGYFSRRRDRHAATVMLWWIAQNLWNISRYIADARIQELPLVGSGEHDWAYLLGEMGLLRQDRVVGDVVHFVGVLLFLAACLWGWIYASATGRGAPTAPDGPPSPP